MKASYLLSFLCGTAMMLGFSTLRGSNAESPHHVYELRPRKDKRGVDLISDVLPFGRLWYTKPDHAIGYAKDRSRSHHAVIRVYDALAM
jgi:hypothetical protein